MFRCTSLIALMMMIGCDTPINTPVPRVALEVAPEPWKVPDLNTCDGVVADLVRHLDEPSRELLRNTPPGGTILYHLSWGMTIRNMYGLWQNSELCKSCAVKAGNQSEIHPDSASGVIMEAVREAVQRKKR